MESLAGLLCSSYFAFLVDMAGINEQRTTLGEEYETGVCTMGIEFVVAFGEAFLWQSFEKKAQRTWGMMHIGMYVYKMPRQLA
jgi:hypothetical protein